MATVLTLRRRGRHDVRGRSTGTTRAAAAGRSTTARARRRRSASWPRARTSTWRRRGRTATRSPTCRCCALVGHPVAVNPDAELARVARAEGWEILRFERLGRRLRVGGARRRRGRRHRLGRAAEGARMSLHELTAEQQEIRALARRFADEQIAPHAAEWDRGHVFPRELFAELGELGLMGVCVPEEQGGAGADFLSYVLVLEELSRADAGVGVTVAVHTSACTLPLLAHGSPYVPRAGGRRGDRGVRAHRGGLGLGRERHAHAGGRRPHHRRQAVDHQRLARLDVPRLRPRGRAHQRVRRARRAPTASRSRARRRSWA